MDSGDAGRRQLIHPNCRRNRVQTRLDLLRHSGDDRWQIARHPDAQQGACQTGDLLWTRIRTIQIDTGETIDLKIDQPWCDPGKHAAVIDDRLNRDDRVPVESHRKWLAGVHMPAPKATPPHSCRHRDRACRRDGSAESTRGRQSRPAPATYSATAWRFAGPGTMQTNSLAAEQGGNRQGDRVGRHLRKGVEAAVVDLLLATGLIEFHHLDPLRIVEISDGRIVEGKMPILTDAKADDIERFMVDQRGIRPAASGRLIRDSVVPIRCTVPGFTASNRCDLRKEPKSCGASSGRPT